MAPFGDDLIPPDLRDRPRAALDARQLPPPLPLQRTLERLAEADPRTVLVQLNDRVPQLLFPKLEDRGYQHESTETAEGVVTLIWQPGP